MSINERFFELLKLHHTKESDFARKTGISTQTINAWKHRGTDPPARYICTIADFFEISLENLLNGTETSYHFIEQLKREE